MACSHKHFKEVIVQNSIANDYSTAIYEWVTKGHVFDKNMHYCICGHPIYELCHIQN
jgi:hypothetical protein